MYLICISVPLPCIVADWSNWSAPDSTGVRFRYRYMIRPALNGGKECPDLMQLGKGIASTKIVEDTTVVSILFICQVYCIVLMHYMQ